MLLNHPSLEFMTVGPLILRMNDRADPTGATVDLEISEVGRPLIFRANRPRIVGRQAIMTPWSATGWEFREWDGCRIPSQTEVAWTLAEGTFTYYRSQITSLMAVR